MTALCVEDKDSTSLKTDPTETTLALSGFLGLAKIPPLTIIQPY